MRRVGKNSFTEIYFVKGVAPTGPNCHRRISLHTILKLMATAD